MRSVTEMPSGVSVARRKTAGTPTAGVFRAELPVHGAEPRLCLPWKTHFARGRQAEHDASPVRQASERSATTERADAQRSGRNRGIEARLSESASTGTSPAGAASKAPVIRQP